MTRYLPMLAKSAEEPFDDNDWSFELKWDGIRAIAYVGESLSLRSRNGREIAPQFPELEGLVRRAPGTVLDGEIIAMADGRPDIQAILPRLQAGDGRLPPSRVKNPVTYIVFDILERDGRPLIALPLSERRQVLALAVTEDPRVAITVPVTGRGRDYYRAAIARGLEGVIAKRDNSAYEPGRRSDSWLKIKGQRTCDCIIAGYTPGQGGRGPAFGALILGLYENTDEQRTGEGISPPDRGERTGVSDSPAVSGHLIYIGKVGTGFSDRDLVSLRDLFLPLRTRTPPLAGTDPGERVLWLHPELVCEVAYQQLTRDRKLRIPRFVRLRADKMPEECTSDQLTEYTISPGGDGKADPDLSSKRRRGGRLISGTGHGMTSLPSPRVTVTPRGTRH
ncbi:MAG: hypothetical protein LUP97_07240 [Methanoregula sp.]|nr:hypothetical protein [Methanoregula sp.]